MWDKIRVGILKAIKFVLHVLTGRSEIERICSAVSFSLGIALSVDLSIRSSTKLIQVQCDLEDESKDPSRITEDVVEQKNITIKQATIFHLEKSLRLIHTANIFVKSLEKLRLLPFDAEKRKGENLRMLEDLWLHMILKPGEGEGSMVIVSERWQEIGFQGKDPRTDFRGMGMLGLENLSHFANYHRAEAVSINQRFQHPINWCPFAITGIQITKFLFDLAKTRKLHPIFFTITMNQGDLHLFFNELFCVIYILFDKFWFEQKGVITEFPFVFERFQAAIKSQMFTAGVSTLFEKAGIPQAF